MRHEIYSRIRQNKMKFYAELNSVKEKAIPVIVVNETTPEADTPVKQKQYKEKNALLKKVQEFDYKSIFKKVPEAVKTGYNGTVKSKAMNALKTQVKNDHEKLKEFSSKVNHKIDRQADKITDRVYNLSSFLFEEPAENDSNPSFSNSALAVEANGNNTIEWNVSDDSQLAVSFYDRLGDFSERSFDWLRSVPGRINDFLASDNLLEPNDAHMIARK
jgi:hypothetical protein